MPMPASPAVPVNTACTTKKTGSTAVRRAMPTSRLSRYQARTRRAAIAAVGEVPSSAGSRRPRPIRCPPELVSGEVSVRRSNRTQTAWSTATRPTASARCTTAANHRPVATSNGRAHAQPKGVHDAMTAEGAASKADRSVASESVVNRVLSTSGMSVTTETTTAPSTRPRRVVITRASALVTARESRIAVSTPSTAPSSAAGTAAGCPSHEPTCASASPQSIRAGMPVQAAASRPRASTSARSGSTAKRAGSRIESTPVAIRLSTVHIKVMSAKSGTVRAVIRSGRLESSTRLGPSSASTPSAARPPTIDETRCRVLRVIAVRHMANRSRTISPTTSAPRRRRRTRRPARGSARAANRPGSALPRCPRRGPARRR